MDQTRMADLEEIRSLSYRYALGVDRFQADEVAAVFTDDAVYDAGALGLPLLKGRDEIRGFFAMEAETMESQYHLSANHLISFAGTDEATGTNYVLAEANMKNGGALKAALVNNDTYRRTPDGWRIGSRTLTPLTPPDLAGFTP